MKPSFGILLASTLCSMAYADELTRAPEQSEVKIPPVKNEFSPQTENLKQVILPSSEPQRHTIEYTGRELVEQPEILEDLFLEALISKNKPLLEGYIKLYQLVPNADQSLIDWATAILLTDVNLNDSVKEYRSLISKLPENNFIRFQLAETLFYNQEFEAAKTQFEKLRAVNQNPDDISVFNRFIEAIDSKEHWNFSFGASFLNDKNLANSAKVGTVAVLPNGSKVTYSTPRQSGQGISAWLGADKQWNISNGKYLKFTSSLNGKYYWDNQYYNDINSSVGLGLGYSNSRWNIEFIPTFQKRWYSGGISASKSLKQYMDTYGFNLSANYWLGQKLKYSVYYDYGYEKYKELNYKQQYNGVSHTLINSITYFPKATQYWALSLDLMKKNAKDKTNAYERIGTRLTWGQEWSWGLSTSTSLGIAKRNYNEASFFGKKQQNKEFFGSMTLWHKEVHYAGFTPRITYSYTKTDSNIPIYSYDKHQVLFNVSKSF